MNQSIREFSIKSYEENKDNLSNLYRILSDKFEERELIDEGIRSIYHYLPLKESLIFIDDISKIIPKEEDPIEGNQRIIIKEIESRLRDEFRDQSFKIPSRNNIFEFDINQLKFHLIYWISLYIEEGGKFNKDFYKRINLIRKDIDSYDEILSSFDIQIG